MMVKWKSWTCWVSMMVAFSIILTGCGGNNVGNSQEQLDQETTEKRQKITVAVQDLGRVPADEGTVEHNRWTNWINENGPVDVEFVAFPLAQEAEKYNTLFASGDAPDLIMTYTSDIRNSLYNQKLVMPVDELIEEHSTEYKALLNEYPELRKLGTKADGKLYEFGRVYKVYPNHTMLIRKDWLDNLNLEVPKTTEELLAVAEAFTYDDPDGNGQADTFGMAQSFVSEMNIDMMFGNGGLDVLDSSKFDGGWVLKDDQIVKNWDSYREVIAFRKELFDKGLSDKDFLTDKNGAKASQDWVNGKLGIFVSPGGVRLPGYNLMADFKQNNPDGQYITIPLPESPLGQFPAIYIPPFSMTMMINAKAENPEAVMKYIDFLVTESTGMTLKYGIEGEHWKAVEDGCPQIIDQEKYQKEVAWNDMYAGPIFPEVKFGDCGLFKSQVAGDTELDQAFLELVEQAEKNMAASKDLTNFTHLGYLPNMPKDIKQIVDGVARPIKDFAIKAIVGGESYTVDQAVADAKATWEQAGGKQVEAWYNEWYQENKNNYITNDELLELIKRELSE